MKKQILILTFVLMLMSLLIGVNASIENIGTVKQYDCITLPQTCNCSYSNITTIMFPNKSYVTINEAMVKDGTYFSYTFCNTSVIGEYIVNGVGDKDGITTPFNYWFEVTTTGNSNNNTIPLFLALGGFIIFIIAVLTRNLYIGFISGAVFIVLGIYLMIFGLGSISDFYTQTLSYVSLGFGLLIFLSASVA
jgi:hypothetical protein